ncbi:CrcB family protein [Herbiconiux sp. L3-i23]|uniref:fluoride efflux transporter FluC n=1 Tax=Herbiconiux sp. L3-i23 TaxID=2905871 RepID=UPI002070D992|nr:CrcB family protein [Herbiconiux sp. L3-i23]BDI23200.1 hypothetical protein L3i23_19760 [Herbiconiux sp. L3-i23]
MTAPTTSEIVAVAVGGVIGTGLRWGLDLLLPHAADEFPTSTLITNLLGTFLLAALVAGVWMRPRTPVWVKAGLGPGVLGTYTTFSAVALALVTLVDASRPGIAALYFVLSLAGGLGAAVAGIALGSRALARRAPEALE